ncbi:MAG: hypothetical protein VX670_11990, partial [Candidatus Latescibacterota bacterium]|nr:hypothetical protein [Candidatus Latescibacterota bacterium]
LSTPVGVQVARGVETGDASLGAVLDPSRSEETFRDTSTRVEEWHPPTKPFLRSRPPLEPPPRRLHASAPAMRISVRGHNFALVGERTMGKVSWPAGHALADWILERGDAAGDAPPEATLVEVGAGCGLPALAAAALALAAAVATSFSGPARERRAGGGWRTAALASAVALPTRV